METVHREDAERTLDLESGYMRCEVGTGGKDAGEGITIGPVDVDGMEEIVLGAGDPAAGSEGTATESVLVVGETVEDVVAELWREQGKRRHLGGKR